jgi:CO/xanthine dehydrogenase FAD-binding subunit
LGRYWRPAGLEAALRILAEERPQLLAGGTDVYPARTQAAAWGAAPDGALLDLTGLAALRGVSREGEHWRIGALTPWAMLRDAPAARRDAERHGPVLPAAGRHEITSLPSASVSSAGGGSARRDPRGADRAAYSSTRTVHLQFW